MLRVPQFPTYIGNMVFVWLEKRRGGERQHRQKGTYDQLEQAAATEHADEARQADLPEHLHRLPANV
jgi:hypothetical protein